MKTYSQKSAEINHKWILVDASAAPLGRVSSFIATRLTGKYKPTYTPHIDDGDYVVVVNADKAIVTGNKETAKTYYSYSGYPGGLKEQSLADVRRSNSAKIIEKAVGGMIPHNKLHSERMKRLRIFGNEEHTHAPQQPVKVEVK